MDQILTLHNAEGITPERSTITVDIINVLPPIIEKSDRDGNEEQIHTDSEHIREPELYPNMMPQPETETETKKDLEEKQKKENVTKKEYPAVEDFKKRIDERFIETFTQDPPNAMIQERSHINIIKKIASKNTTSSMIHGIN